MYELNNALKSVKITTPGKDTFSYEKSSYKKYLNSTIALGTRALYQHNGRRPMSYLFPSLEGRPTGRYPSFKISLRSWRRLTWLLAAHRSLFGFVRGKSTTDAIAQVIGDITNGRQSNGHSRTTVATYLDLDKALERAQPLAILNSLIILGFKGKILAWPKDYLSNRSIVVVALQGFNSNEHRTDTGLPQGSILGPTLFNAHVIIILKQTVTTWTILHAYADDLVLISNGRDPFGRMQQALNRLTAAAESLGLFFSAPKTKIMLFYCIPENIPRFTIGKQPIELVKTHRYLGVVIDDKLHFTPHAKYIKEKLTSSSHFIEHSLRLFLHIPPRLYLWRLHQP